MDSPMKPWILMQSLWIVTCGQDGGSGSIEVSSSIYVDYKVAKEAFMDAVCSWHETYSTSAVLYTIATETTPGRQHCSPTMAPVYEAVVLDDGTLVVWQSLGESTPPSAEETERLVEAGIDVSQVEELEE